MENIKLTPREKAFCSSFLNSGCAEHAAKRAGYSGNCRKTGERLLCRTEIAEEIELLAKQREKSLANMASVGYQRLAFGNICDAVSLLYMENPAKKDLDDMDLFLVSEIRRPKDGSMEIKFFDRLKALEKLENKGDNSGGITDLFNAINKGAEAVKGDSTEN